MHEIIYAYNGKERIWKEVNLPDRPENMPIFFIVEYKEEYTQESWLKVWCPFHNAYEEIENHNDDVLITSQGCRLEGFCVKADVFIAMRGFNIYQHPSQGECYGYWTMKKNAPSNTIQYIHKYLSVSHTWEKDASDGRVRIVPHLRFWREYEKNESLPKNNELAKKCSEEKIPPPVTIEDIQENNQIDYVYTKNDYQIYEKRINSYNFRLISSRETFKNITNSMPTGNFVENENPFDGATALVAVEHQGRYLLTLILSGAKVKNEYGAYFIPSLLKAVKLYVVTDCWAKLVGIDKSYLSSKEYESIKDYLVVNKPSLNKRPALKDLLMLPEKDVKPGYYLDLHLSLSAARIPKRHTASYGEIHDDKHRLTKALPFAKRLFAAAWDGNSEAQYVMYLLYDTNSCFTNTNSRKSQYWLREAIKNGWKPFEKVRLDNSRLFN